jgi:ankyrin repeat protein
VRHLASYGADLELRDGEGHSALWCAVREQREEMVAYLIKRGAKVFYRNQDISCPLQVSGEILYSHFTNPICQLACKTPLLKESGQKIASLLVAHGANLEYQDIALRNTLFWVVYNNRYYLLNTKY